MCLLKKSKEHSDKKIRNLCIGVSLEFSIGLIYIQASSDINKLKSVYTCMLGQAVISSDSFIP